MLAFLRSLACRSLRERGGELGSQRSSRLQVFDVIAGGWAAPVAILEAQLGIIKNRNVLGYPIIDRQKLPDYHVLPFWLVARIPKLDHRFFPLIGDSTA